MPARASLCRVVHPERDIQKALARLRDNSTSRLEFQHNFRYVRKDSERGAGVVTKVHRKCRIIW